mmetsp:Transcript_6472/g.9246  ORF Transcript_6472/g.9246 Transcript_6472/m.9246 type:complete len:381 (-) Transcript_6472:1555-2697(-)
MGAIPLVDLRRENEVLGEEMRSAVSGVMDRGEYIMGREVRELEEKLKRYCGASHCVCVSSGTDALLLALMALGVGEHDEVVTSPFSWVSSAEVIAFLGAKVVFVDINPETYLVEPEAVKAAVTPKTKAVIPVSIFGQMADVVGIQDAVGASIPVIEDGAQSFGARRGELFSCSSSVIGTTSFFPTKPLACCGDGGAVFTSDGTIAATIRSLRVHGKDGVTKLFSSVGMNARLDTMQAAILLVKLKHLDSMLEKRILAAQRYAKLLEDVEGVKAPVVTPSAKHAYAVYTIRISKSENRSGEERRESIRQSFSQNEIGFAIYYDRCIHQQPAYAAFASGRTFPACEAASAEVISLPIHPWLTYEDQATIVSVLKKALHSGEN